MAQEIYAGIHAQGKLIAVLPPLRAQGPHWGDSEPAGLSLFAVKSPGLATSGSSQFRVVHGQGILALGKPGKYCAYAPSLLYTLCVQFTPMPLSGSWGSISSPAWMVGSTAKVCIVCSRRDTQCLVYYWRSLELLFSG